MKNPANRLMTRGHHCHSKACTGGVPQTFVGKIGAGERAEQVLDPRSLSSGINCPARKVGVAGGLQGTARRGRYVLCCTDRRKHATYDVY